MIILLFIEGLVGISLFRWFKNRHSSQSLSTWANTPTVPIFSDLLARATGGEIQDRKKRLAANVFKTAVRKYVASDLFDHAVAGLMNRESFVHGIAARLKHRFNSGPSFDGEGAVSEAFR